MGDFSRDTFNRLKHYVSVRLQQGVPVLDADWNELQDIRKFELEAFLKWFVGDGVPAGNDGFAIDSAGAADDFLIADGHCLVEGWDVVNDWAEEHGGGSLSHTSQRLLRNSDLLSWGLAELPELGTLTSDRTDTVYLDVWEREVDSAEDDDIVNPDIGIETCVRIKRDWVVRVAPGVTETNLPDAPSGHVFYPLARLNRKAAPAVIDDITDLRRTGLTLSTNNDIQQIVTDAYGAGYTLDGDGQPNLEVSLRQAINSLLAGRLPGTAVEQFVVDADFNTEPYAFQDAAGDIWVFWNRDSEPGIWYRRYTSMVGSWSDEQPLTSDSHHDDRFPFAFEDSSGDVWVFWISFRVNIRNIWCNRYDRDAEMWGVDETVGTDVNSLFSFGRRKFSTFEASNGDIWMFWESDQGGNDDIWYNRYVRSGDGGAWDGELPFASSTEDETEPFALEDQDGIIWLFWGEPANEFIRYKTYDGSVWTEPSYSNDKWSAHVGGEGHFAVEDGSGDILIFWKNNPDNTLWYRRFHRPTLQWGSKIQLTIDPCDDYFVTRDDKGDVWAFWAKYESDVAVLSYKHYTEESGWGAAVEAAEIRSEYITALLDREGGIWTFWVAHREEADQINVFDIEYRRFLSKI